MTHGARLCSFHTASGEGRDINGRLWRWDFSKIFGPVFVDKYGNPLKAQPIKETHPAWGPFNTWYAKRKGSVTEGESQ